MAESEKEKILKGLEKEAVKKIQSFIDNDTQDWVLRREDLQNTGIGGDGYDDAGVMCVICEFESVISQAPDYEIVVVLDRDGRFAMARRGVAGRVDGIMRSDVAGKIVMHNHPNGILLNSYEDIDTMVRGEIYEFRTVVQDGRFCSLEKTGQDSGDFSGDYLAKFGNSHDGKLGEVARRALAVEGKNEPSDNEVIQKAEILVNTWLDGDGKNYGYHFGEGRYEL